MATFLARLDASLRLVCGAYHSGQNLRDVVAQQDQEVQQVLKELLEERKGSLVFLTTWSTKTAQKPVLVQVCDRTAHGLSAAAHLVNKHFKKILRGLVRSDKLSFGPVKSIEGIKRKQEAGEEILDLNRATILFNSEGDLIQLIALLETVFTIVSFKNKFRDQWDKPSQPPCLHYVMYFKTLPDVLAKLMNPGSSYFVEIQFTMEAFLTAKKRCHCLYEISRTHIVPRGCPVCGLHPQKISRTELILGGGLGEGLKKRVFACHYKGENLAYSRVAEGNGADDVRDQVKQEMGKMIPLEHINIVPILGVIDEPQEIGFLAPLADGTLSSCLGTMDDEQCWDAALQICCGLIYTHSHSLVHYDLKPANLLCFRTSSRIIVKINDFGHARFQQSVSPSGGIFGASPFSAPELCKQLTDSHEASADVWSLGCILITIFHPQHKHPWSDNKHFVTSLKKGNQPPELQQIEDLQVRYVIGKCMAFKPSARPTMKEVMRLLLRVKNSRHSVNIEIALQSVGAYSEQDLLHKITETEDEIARVSTPPPAAAQKLKASLSFIGTTLLNVVWKKKETENPITSASSAATEKLRESLGFLEAALLKVRNPGIDITQESILENFDVKNADALACKVQQKQHEIQAQELAYRAARRQSLNALEDALCQLKIFEGREKFANFKFQEDSKMMEYSVRVKNETAQQIHVFVFHGNWFSHFGAPTQQFQLAGKADRLIREKRHTIRIIVYLNEIEVARTKICADKETGKEVKFVQVGPGQGQEQHFELQDVQDDIPQTALQVVQTRSQLLDIWEQENYYQTLGVTRDTPIEQIKQAYRKIMLDNHPDKNPSDDATIIAQHLNEAWAVLGDPAKKLKYDRLLDYNSNWLGKAKWRALFCNRGWKFVVLVGFSLLAVAGGVVAVVFTAGTAAPLVVGVGGAVGGGSLTGGISAFAELFSRTSVAEGIEFTPYLRRFVAGFIGGAIGGAAAAPISWAILGPAMATAPLGAHLLTGTLCGSINGFTFSLCDGFASGRFDSQSYIKSTCQVVVATLLGAGLGTGFGAGVVGLTALNASAISQQLADVTLLKFGANNVASSTFLNFAKLVETYLVVDVLHAPLALIGRAVNAASYQVQCQKRSPRIATQFLLKTTLENLAQALRFEFSETELERFWKWSSILRERPGLTIGQWSDKLLFWQSVVNLPDNEQPSPTHSFTYSHTVHGPFFSRMVVQKHLQDTSIYFAKEYYNLGEVCALTLEAGEVVRVWFEAARVGSWVQVIDADISKVEDCRGLFQYKYKHAQEKPIQRKFTLDRGLFYTKVAKIVDGITGNEEFR